MFHLIKCSRYALQRANRDRNMFILTMIETTWWGSFDLGETKHVKRVKHGGSIHGQLLVIMQNPASRCKRTKIQSHNRFKLLSLSKMEFFVAKIAQILSSCDDLKGPWPLKGLGSVNKLHCTEWMQQQVPAPFLGFKSAILKNFCVFVNCINYIEAGVKRVWNWRLMWTMQLQTCLGKLVSFKHVCFGVSANVA